MASVDGCGMDATTAAVALIGQQMEISKVDLAVKMVRQNEESKRGMIEMIAASAESGNLYSPRGGVVNQVVSGVDLDVSA